ncbi:transcription factor SPT20 homolog [Teleopsis dalmanni]|uniref:transcription factor SPT20 homolog n=1 Tax=Teleopsis dalmanni TaxID=139649 RepID=UPI0018CE8520|nr:transcription factor SPT20 homolog [Teleopsis dalmanni]
MKLKLFVLCFVIGLLNTNAKESSDDTKSTTKSVEDKSTTLKASSPKAVEPTETISKDKRQIGAKETAVYPNHRLEANIDDPENPQETIYGPKPSQFIIRPIAAQQSQLRNYPVTIRPHSTQLLEQSQEIQHFAYLQDINRSQQPKSTQDKVQAAQSKKIATTAATLAQSQYNNNVDEAEQRYTIAIQPQAHLRQYPSAQAFQAQVPIPQQQQLQQQQHQQQQQQQQHQQQQQQQYQIIPEEQFLKLIEEELQARAYHEAQFREQQQQQHIQQQQQQQQQQHQQQQQQRQQPVTAATHQNDRIGKGLNGYRQSPIEEPTPQQYVQYVPQHRGGPKYLPLSQNQAQIADSQLAEQELEQQIPPQIAYYHPQNYKALPNHPLAKSSLEKEIEKLLATNKPSAAALHLIPNIEPQQQQLHQQHIQPQPQLQQIHHQRPQPQLQLQQTRPAPRPHVQPKAFIATTPNSLLDANNQPFIPSLFKFSNFQTPTPVYPTSVPQQIIDAKKLGPVVYPTETSNQQPAQPSQYYYQEAAPNAVKSKPYRAKQYSNKQSTAAPTKPRQKEVKLQSAPPKYSQPLIYDFENPTHLTPGQFYPSQPDPIKPQSTPQPTHAAPPHNQPPTDYRPYALPNPSPSQSSIYVSQGTGINTRQTTIKPKTVEDVKQLRLPQPGGKPLTQAEFQALVDAGYPVTAVPVPVPVPYEQFIKEHPDYRNQPIDYNAQLGRFAQQYAPPAHGQQQRSLAAASEPAVKIISPGPTEQQNDDESAAYLRQLNAQQKRRPRDEKETAVSGKKES